MRHINSLPKGRSTVRVSKNAIRDEVEYDTATQFGKCGPGHNKNLLQRCLQSYCGIFLRVASNKKNREVSKWLLEELNIIHGHRG